MPELPPTGAAAVGDDAADGLDSLPSSQSSQSFVPTQPSFRKAGKGGSDVLALRLIIALSNIKLIVRFVVLNVYMVLL